MKRALWYWARLLDEKKKKNFERVKVSHVIDISYDRAKRVLQGDWRNPQFICRRVRSSRRRRADDRHRRVRRTQERRRGL